MKVKDTNSSRIDLEEEELKSKWAEEMIENFNGKIPIITSLKKGCAHHHLSIKINSRLHAHAEALVYQTKRFNCPTEVHRHCLEMGHQLTHILFRKDGTQEQKMQSEAIYKALQAVEDITIKCQLSDAVLLEAKSIIETARAGVIDFEEMDKAITTLIRSLPQELRSSALHKIEQFKAGVSVGSLLETKISKAAQKKYRIIS